jgi:hypothetical protein
MRFEIVNHGPDYPDYFQGCGVAFTPFDNVVTGIGNTAKEAYFDALDSMAQQDSKSAERMPNKPHGIRESDSVPHSMGPDAYWYVSIRWSK